MKSINVQVAVKPAAYELIMGCQLQEKVTADLKENPLGSRYAIITDSTVDELWGDSWLRSLRNAGLTAEKFVFPAGERNKTRAVKEQLEDQLMQRSYGRDSAILALGGGVVGDVAGFVAATYMRGIPVVQLPTTTLAMADSSIGGKTAVDTEYGKNLIGAFHHPVRVYMDMDMLRTLDERNYRAGLAELVKHGLIMDPSILDFLSEHMDAVQARDSAVLEALFEKNCQVKNTVVAQDDQEKGLRQILNYGHTLGHAVEVLSDFKLIHGECVSIGMDFAARLAREMGLCTEELVLSQRAVLTELGLPTALPAELDTQELLTLMKRDKKARQGTIRFVLPVALGKVTYGEPVSEEAILNVMQRGS